MVIPKEWFLSVVVPGTKNTNILIFHADNVADITLKLVSLIVSLPV